MADFKTALDALAEGKLKLEKLSKQLDKLLQQNPRHALRILEQLDEAYSQEKIGDQDYAALKRQVNEYRRQHARETETGEAGADSTVFARDDAGPEQAASAGGDEGETQSHEATRVMDEEEKSGDQDTPSGNSVDFDISMDQSDTSPSVGSATGPTSTAWEEPRQADSAEGREMGPGDVIKERFKLMDVLGVGGMGKVFKGIDLLKEEAKDKNPYVAIKLLNEDFKSHPEAFISLQRESSRQQKLAHPNIATVYDFDRIGGPGTPVFITMELMEGQPLNTFLKKNVRKQGGLPFDEAFPIVRQLAAALDYAHERRLVHSDFKPGNAFLCNDGTVKTLDFGIARAVKNPVTGEAEKTLFDPGKLGALTPAYASLEMLEGEEPDTRDDIYALGCVAYELLTGKHPFNKLPANTARDNGLVPAPVKGLNKKQNRALRHALAFKREDRSQDVKDFIEEFEGKATWYKNPWVIAAEILLVIGLVMIGPAMNYLHEQEIQRTITDIQSGDNETVAQILEEIRSLDRSDINTITDEAKDTIQGYYSDQLSGLINTASDNYNFPAAENVLQEIAEFYPDSIFLENQRAELEFNKKQKITDLYQEYIAALDPQQAVQNPDAIDKTREILATIRERIDPNHSLLDDPRPANAYRLAAQQAYEDGDYEKALSFVSSGLDTAPEDARLADLQTLVQNAIRVTELSESLEGVRDELASLEDYKQYEEEITELARLSTREDSPILETLADGLRETVNTELQRILQDGSRADAEALAGEMDTLLSALQLGNELTQIKLAHLSGAERTEAINNIVAESKSEIESRLASPDIDSTQWEAELLANVRELDSLKEEDTAIAGDLENIRRSIADLYLKEAETTLEANRFDAAESYVNRGQRFAPDLPALQETETRVASARAEFERQQRINDLKEQFDYQTEADRVAEANDILDQLKQELPEDDPYITTEAPAKLANSYSRLAERRAENGEYASALQLAEAGLELAPDNRVLRAIRNEYRVEVNITELGETFRNATSFSADQVVELSRKVNEIEQGAPGRYNDFRRESEAILAERINNLAQTDENAAAALADAASSIFPTSSELADLTEQFQLEPWPQQATANAALSAGELSRANNILQEAMDGEYAGHPQVIDFQEELNSRMQQANDSFEAYQQAQAEAGDSYNNLRQAKRLLQRAQALWVDNPDYDSAENEIDQLIANAPDNPAKRVIRREEVDIAAASGSSGDQQEAEKWQPVSSGRECNSALAGHGSRARAICYDLVNTGWRGPLMVVVPPGGPLDKEFAIGKYEISVGDWSKYCALTGRCKPETNKEKFDDPVTGVTLKQAQEYVDWLSERTGKTYRLPNADEWQYAASVGGKLTPDSDEFRSIKGTLNCRVTLGDKVLKGTGITSIKSGRSNEWGLKNFVGNVQEWVMGSDGVTAVGGAYSDAINNCDLSNARSHDGGADDTTGFRVILEEVG
ncbi:MAG: protein kinase [Gammaproteobacteria bacterium]